MIKISKENLVISTFNGLIQHIPNKINHTILIYLDDLIYKDSILIEGITTINDYCHTKQSIAISVRNSVVKNGHITLETIRGNYRLNKSLYDQIIAALKPAYYFNFDTQQLLIDGKIFVEPKGVEDFVKLSFSSKNLIFGTEFINTLVSKGCFLEYNEKDELTSKSLTDSDGYDYEKYLLSIKEINVFTFLAKKSYGNFFPELQ